MPVCGYTIFPERLCIGAPPPFHALLVLQVGDDDTKRHLLFAEHVGEQPVILLHGLCDPATHAQQEEVDASRALELLDQLIRMFDGTKVVVLRYLRLVKADRIPYTERAIALKNDVISIGGECASACIGRRVGEFAPCNQVDYRAFSRPRLSKYDDVARL